MKDSTHFDTDTAWQKLDARVHRLQTSRSVRTLIYRRIAVAAAIAIIVTTGGFLWKANWQQQTIAATTENKSILLPDGSSILLRKGSTVRYKKAFNKQRTIDLTGEAFFQVQQDEKHPFRIITANTEIKVLGTSFLVRSQETKDEIVVSTGKVSAADRKKAGKEILLEAGTKGLLLKNEWQQSTINDANDLAWTTGVLEFNNTPLVKALEDIASYYQISINVEGPSAQSMLITAHFRNQSLEQVLEEIQLLTGLEMKKDGLKALFYKK